MKNSISVFTGVLLMGSLLLGPIFTVAGTIRDSESIAFLIKNYFTTSREIG